MLDTKLKNNKGNKLGLRIFLGILLIAAITVANLWMYPELCRAVEETSGGSLYTKELDTDNLSRIYHSTYVMYQDDVTGYDSMLSEEERAGRAFIKDYAGISLDAETTDTKAAMAISSIINEWRQDYESFAYDMYSISGSWEVVRESVEKDAQLQEYDLAFVLYFGNQQTKNLSVEILTCPDDIDEEDVLFYLNAAYEDDGLVSAISDYEYRNGMVDNLDLLRLNGPQDYAVAFGICENSVISPVYDYAEGREAAMIASLVPYAASMLLVLLAVIFLTSRHIWKGISYQRKGYCYVAEIGVAGLIVAAALSVCYGEIMWSLMDIGWRDIFAQLWPFTYANIDNILQVTVIAAVLFSMYALGMISMICLRPMFTLGPAEYVRQYSLGYGLLRFLYRGIRKIVNKCRKLWHDFKDEIHHLDFTQKGTSTILKVVIINFVVLALLIFIWIFGLVGLVLYSVVLFFLLQHFYDKIAADYRKLQESMNRMAEGDLNEMPMEDMGMFNPMRDELNRIRGGFKKAVNEEVKSQRMKTELITNVSHDLKTPLTAITTYIELLKKDDITDEERASYIETLERKAFRLKVLIEDLFEMSKAQSANVTLDLMDVDLVNLMRQVVVEHREKLDAMGMELRWNVPEEKVILQLDNQKTYRIFENLFVNVEKYAMPGSRVYIDVKTAGEHVTVIIKNISAEELNVSPDELTERFVRGDKSRNTEGSGLGLAIAKSFTELQKGTFRVEVDGDLFKVILEW